MEEELGVVLDRITLMCMHLAKWQKRFTLCRGCKAYYVSDQIRGNTLESFPFQCICGYQEKVQSAYLSF